MEHKTHFVVETLPDTCRTCDMPDPYGLRCTLTGQPASGVTRPAHCPLECLSDLIRGGMPREEIDRPAPRVRGLCQAGDAGQAAAIMLQMGDFSLPAPSG